MRPWLGPLGDLRAGGRPSETSELSRGAELLHGPGAAQLSLSHPSLSHSYLPMEVIPQYRTLWFSTFLSGSLRSNILSSIFYSSRLAEILTRVPSRSKSIRTIQHACSPRQMRRSKATEGRLVEVRHAHSITCLELILLITFRGLHISSCDERTLADEAGLRPPPSFPTSPTAVSQVCYQGFSR